MKPYLLAVVASSFAAAPAFAQTGAALLLDPWFEDPREEGGQGLGVQSEVDASGAYVFDADIEDTDEGLSIGEFSAEGRFRLNGGGAEGPSLGFESLHLQLNTDDPALPERLADHSVALGFGKELNDRWRVGAVVGAGYAGTRPFSDGDSVYFLADLIAGYAIDEKSSVTINLNYNGNRNVLPDVPLPGVSYARRSDIEGLRYIVGFPYSNVVYQPDDRWTLQLGYVLPFSFTARAEYKVAEHLSLFGDLGTFTRGFWVEDDATDEEHSDDRIFFTQRRLEAGVIYEALERVNVELAGGYAFGQEFETGWDSRDTDELREVDAAPYVRVGVELAF